MTTQPLNVDTSVVDLLKSKGMDSSPDARTALAKSYGLTGYSVNANNAAQNMALMALIQKGGPSVDNSKISGSASVSMNNNATTAVSSAASGSGLVTSPTAPTTTGVNPATAGFHPETNASVVSTVDNGNGTHTVTLSDGTTAITSVDPVSQAALTSAQTSFQDQSNAQNAQFQEELQSLQEAKAKAVSAAEASIDAATSGLVGTEKAGFLANVGKSYDEQIGNLQTNFSQVMTTLKDNLASTVNGINAQVQANSRSDFSTSLANLPGSSPLSQADYSTLMGNALTAGLDPKTAALQISNAQQNATLAYNKAMTAQDKTTATQNKSLLLPALAQLATPFSSLSPDEKKTYEDLAIQAGIGVPANSTIADAIANGTVNMKEVDAYLDTQTKGVQAKAAQDAKIAEENATISQNAQRIVILQQNADTNTNKETTSEIAANLKTYIASVPGYLASVKTSADLSNAVTTMMEAVPGATASQVRAYMLPFVGQMPKEVQKVVQSPNLFQKLMGGDTITDTSIVPGTGGGATIDDTGDSSPTSGTLSSGITWTVTP